MLGEAAGAQGLSEREEQPVTNWLQLWRHVLKSLCKNSKAATRYCPHVLLIGSCREVWNLPLDLSPYMTFPSAASPAGHKVVEHIMPILPFI